MAGTSDIMVRFGADVGPLKKGSQQASISLKDVKASAIESGKAIASLAAAGIAAGAAMVAMANNSAENAREIKNLAKVSGVGVQEFQKLAFGAKTVGIEQEKLADIFKDTQDKIGDFIQTGGGPLADFFENIAPDIGVTAEQFRNLSGPDALGLYVSSLEKANLSQSEMVFFMEAIASDSALLTPLLKDNGKAFDELGAKIEGVNGTLTDLDIANLEDMKVNLDLAGQAAKTATDKISAQLAPAISVLTERFIGLSGEAGSMEESFDKAFTFGAKAAGIMANGVHGIHIIIKGLEVAFDGFSILVNTVIMDSVKTFDLFGNTINEGINVLIDGMNNIPGVDIGKLATGQSRFAEIMTGVTDQAKANMEQSQLELHDLLMQPLPSDAVDQFLEDVKEKRAQIKEELIDEQLEAVSNMPTADEDPAYQRALDLNKLIADAEKTRRDTSIKTAAEAAAAKEAIESSYAKTTITGANQLFSNLATLRSSESKKAFEIGKAAAASQTIMSTYSAAQKSYEALAHIPVVGPALGVAAAAAAIVGGLGRLQQINSTSFNSKSASGGSGGGGAGASVPQSQSAAGVAGGSGSSQTMVVEGINSEDLFTGDNVRTIAGALLDFQKDGGQVVLT